MFAQIHDSSLEFIKHISKNNKSGQTKFFFFFKLLGHGMKALGNFFFFFGGLGHGLGPNWGMACGCPTGWVWSEEKNLFNKRAESGLLGQTRGLGPGMGKPNPNPTRCHSYPTEEQASKPPISNHYHLDPSPPPPTCSPQTQILKKKKKWIADLVREERGGEW